ncbi:MAG TPA: GNAT family N-acetyltransferase [Gemmatimonadaceae bacterium]
MLAPALKRLEVRAAREPDLAAAIALLEWELPKNPWMERTAEQLTEAIRKPKAELMACVAAREGEIVGFGVYGIVAGTIGSGMIHAILVAPRSRRAGIGLKILEYATADLASRRMRVIFAEMPADPYLVRYRALLLSYGFFEETRIDDYYRDGVSQIISRRDL